MPKLLRATCSMLLMLTVLTGIVYPALITAVAQTVFSERANGSLIRRDGVAIGSELIGQEFDEPGYFWGRPSATAPVPYHAASSGGANWGPTNPALIGAVRKRIERLKRHDPDKTVGIPIDLATASGSGLDPHISPAAARYQAPRVAAARGMSLAEVEELIAISTTGRTLGILGEPRVNVLQLNLALNERAGAK